MALFEAMPSTQPAVACASPAARRLDVRVLGPARREVSRWSWTWPAPKYPRVRTESTSFRNWPASRGAAATRRFYKGKVSTCTARRKRHGTGCPRTFNNLRPSPGGPAGSRAPTRPSPKRGYASTNNDGRFHKLGGPRLERAPRGAVQYLPVQPAAQIQPFFSCSSRWSTRTTLVAVTEDVTRRGL